MAEHPRQGSTVVAKGSLSAAHDGNTIEVDADSSFDYPTHIRAISWELRRDGKLLALRSMADRGGEGPNHSEFISAIHGIHAARTLGANSVHLRTDNRLTASILTGMWTARQPNICVLQRIASYEIYNLDNLLVTWVRTREIKRVDSAAKKIRNRLRSDPRRRLITWLASNPEVDRIKWRTGFVTRPMIFPAFRRRRRGAMLRESLHGGY